MKADNQNLRLDGKILALRGLGSNEDYSKGRNEKEENLISRDSKVERLVEKNIPTEKRISFKEFAREQRLRNGN